MIDIPADIQAWLRGVFSRAANEATSMLDMASNVHEETLDQALIVKLARETTPRRFADWTVQIRTHWLGGYPLYFEPGRSRGWEIADIGLLVVFSSGGKLVRTKIALLQSKRLFANEQQPETEDERELRYRKGFTGMLPAPSELENLTGHQTFHFDPSSQYKSLIRDDHQYKRVASYEEQKKYPVYYLLYNPSVLPHSIDIPSQPAMPKKRTRIGCRVVPATLLRKALEDAGVEGSPSYARLANHLTGPFLTKAHQGGWGFSHFVVDRLLQCKAGRVTDMKDDPSLFGAFYGRTRPIAAAIGLTIDAPAGFDWTVIPDKD